MKSKERNADLNDREIPTHHRAQSQEAEAQEKSGMEKVVRLERDEEVAHANALSAVQDQRKSILLPPSKARVRCRQLAQNDQAAVDAILEHQPNDARRSVRFSSCAKSSFEDHAFASAQQVVQKVEVPQARSQGWLGSRVNPVLNLLHE